MLRTRVTNPTKIGRSYAWMPGGLNLAANESKVVDFDPISVIQKQIFKNLCLSDLKCGYVVFEYIIEAPCRYLPDAKQAKAETFKKPVVVSEPPVKPPALKQLVSEAERPKRTAVDVMTGQEQTSNPDNFEVSVANERAQTTPDVVKQAAEPVAAPVAEDTALFGVAALLGVEGDAKAPVEGIGVFEPTKKSRSAKKIKV